MVLSELIYGLDLFLISFLNLKMISAFISDLCNLGDYIDDNIETYVMNVVATQGGSWVSIWIQQIRPREMMDDHILMGVLSEMDFLLGTVICHPNTAQKICELSFNAAADIGQNTEEISARFRHFLTKGSNSTILVPLCSSTLVQWGMLIVQGKDVVWADTLAFQSFGGRRMNVLEIVKLLMQNSFPNDSWIVKFEFNEGYENFMLDQIGYEKQKKCFSCGFNVMVCLCTLAATLGN